MTRYVEIVCNNVILAHKAKVMSSFLGKAKGLMFSRFSGPGGLVFELEEENRRNAAIHMMFVFSRIDVVWLDSSKRVVDVRHELLPFIGFVIPKSKAKYVVELPVGTAKTVQKGDQMELKELD